MKKESFFTLILLGLVSIMLAVLLITSSQSTSTLRSSNYLESVIGKSSSSTHSTWYCSYFSNPATTYETLSLENLTSHNLSGSYLLISNGVKRQIKFNLQASTYQTANLDALFGQPVQFARVNINGGGTSVNGFEMTSIGPLNVPCAPQESTSWFLPSGSTFPGSEYLIGLYNPTNTPCVVSVRFLTVDGMNSPYQLSGTIINPGQFSVIDAHLSMPNETIYAGEISSESNGLFVAQSYIYMPLNNGVINEINLGIPHALVNYYAPPTVGFSQVVRFVNMSPDASKVQVTAKIIGVNSASIFTLMVPGNSDVDYSVLSSSAIPSGQVFSLGVSASSPIIVIGNYSSGGYNEQSFLSPKLSVVANFNCPFAGNTGSNLLLYNYSNSLRNATIYSFDSHGKQLVNKVRINANSIDILNNVAVNDGEILSVVANDTSSYLECTTQGGQYFPSFTSVEP